MYNINSEIVQGKIIGDNYNVFGYLYYNGRKQSNKFYGKNDNDIKIQAENYIKQLKEDNLILFNSIYPNHKAKFEVRIYDN